MFRSHRLIFSSAATQSAPRPLLLPAETPSNQPTAHSSMLPVSSAVMSGEYSTAPSPTTTLSSSGIVKGEACVGCASTSQIRVHYNAPSCHGCKAFFRRSVFEGRQYACSGENNCDIAHESRNRCRACRFRKCLEGGMNPKQVREERAKPSPPDVVPNSDQEAERKPSPPASVESELTTFLVGLEHQLDHLADDDVQPDMQQWSRDISLSFGLQNPKLVLKRSPVNWRCERVMTTEDLYSQWYRAFVLHADWAMGIPDFRVIPLHDQTALFKQNFMAFGWITYAFKCYDQGMMERGLPLGNGSYIPYSDIDQTRLLEPRWAKSYGVVCQKLIDLIARPMRDMGMTFEEHCLVKAISLFQKDCPLSETAYAACNRIRDRLMEALALHIDCRFPHLTQHQKTARAMKCVLLLPSFNHIGQLESSMIQNLSSVDLNQLSGVPMEILNTHRPGNRLK